MQCIDTRNAERIVGV